MFRFQPTASLHRVVIIAAYTVVLNLAVIFSANAQTAVTYEQAYQQRKKALDEAETKAWACLYRNALSALGLKYGPNKAREWMLKLCPGLLETVDGVGCAPVKERKEGEGFIDLDENPREVDCNKKRFYSSGTLKFVMEEYLRAYEVLMAK